MSQKIICVPRVAAVRCQMAATFSTRALIFESGKSAAVGGEQPGIEGQLAAVGGDGEGVVLPRVHLLRAEPLVALDQLLLDGALLLGHRAGDDGGLAAFQARPRQVEHLGRLHVGEGAEHLLQFRQVGEPGEAAARPQAGCRPARSPSCRPLRRTWRPRRRNARCRGSRRPSGSRKRCIVYISTIVLLIGVPVAKVTPWPGCCSVQVAGLHVEVEGPLAARRSGCRRPAPSWSASPGS